MANKLLLVLVIAAIVKHSTQSLDDNKIDDINPLAEAAAAIMQEQGAQNIGALVNNLMQQGGGAQQLGDVLFNNEHSGQILQGLGSMLGQGQGSGSLLNVAMNLLQGDGKEGGIDPGTLLSMLGTLMGDGSEKKNLMDYLPMILSSVNSFIGPEADSRAKEHADHAWLLPPVVEKLHITIDHFLHSEIGKNLIHSLAGEKYIKIFQDDSGKLSYRKFVDMLENHSFRKHWITMVTDKIATTISYASDPKTQKKYLTTFQHFLNSILKSQGFPKTALFDQNRPIETLTAAINYFGKVAFNVPISSKQYVKPAVEYVQDLFKLAQKKGILATSSVDSRQLSNKLADTINMDIIEPLARVNRAYRYATKVPACDKYVMCLVNQEKDDPHSSLPGLKPILSKGISYVLSWFLSSQTGTSFWSLYHVITEETNCQARFLEECNGFHIEEMKVTTEFVHNEL